MCGIVGLKNFNNREIIDKNKFLFFLDSLKHRGPDGKDIFLNKNRNLALGHQRLSIYDPDKRSNQPFEYLNKYVISFNGSIYNYIELKEELIAQNYKFNTLSDTEVILAAYDKWGENAVKKFNGIWAFIIYNKQDDKIFVSRDRFGVKPIYYYKTDKIIAFASELKSFLYLYNFEKKIDYEYISKTVEDIQTIEIKKETYLHNTYRLLPGENMFVDKQNTIYINRYWDLNKEINEFKKEKINSSNSLDLTEKLINNSCKLRNRSDVPLSVSLSGGLDSSIILNNLININSDKINAFYCQYTDENHNEDEFIDSLKNKFNFNLYKTKHIDNLTFEEIKSHLFSLDDVYYHLLIGPYNNYKHIKSKNFKISIDGQGADELFCGYTQCINDLIIFSPNLFSFLKNYLKYKKILKNLNKGTYKFKISFLIYLIRYNSIKYKKLSRFLILIVCLINKNIFFNKIKKLYLKYLEFQIKSKVNFKFNEKKIEPNSLNDILIHYFNKVSLPNILRVYDRVSMNNAVEVRMPFLDFNLVKHSFSLSNKYKINENFTKVALREIYKNRLPKKIIQRKNKMGFADPMKEFYLKHKIEIIDLIEKNNNEKFKSWNNSYLLEYVKTCYQYNYFDDLQKIWPYINYYIILDSLNSIHKKNLSMEFTL